MSSACFWLLAGFAAVLAQPTAPTTAAPTPIPTTAPTAAPTGLCTVTTLDYIGDDVVTNPIPFNGTTEDERDASCCQACAANAQCQFWLRTTNDTARPWCWLRKNLADIITTPGRRSGWKTGVPPPTRAPTRSPTTRPTTQSPTSRAPTATPTTAAPTPVPTSAPTTPAPTSSTPTSSAPTLAPTTPAPTTSTPTSSAPTPAPTTPAPTSAPTTAAPTPAPTAAPTGNCNVTTLDYTGNDVTDPVAFNGTTEDERDASCCQACAALPQCQFWLRTTNDSARPYCWLRRNLADILTTPGRRSGWTRGVPPPTRAPTRAPTTRSPTQSPTSRAPTAAPTTAAPTPD